MPNSRNIDVRDENRVTTMMGVSSATTTINGIAFVAGVTPVPIAVDPVTNIIVTETV